MILRGHRFCQSGGGEESIEIPIPKDLEDDIAQGSFNLSLMVDTEDSVDWDDKIIWSVEVPMGKVNVL